MSRSSGTRSRRILQAHKLPLLALCMRHPSAGSSCTTAVCSHVNAEGKKLIRTALLVYMHASHVWLSLQAALPLKWRASRPEEPHRS